MKPLPERPESRHVAILRDRVENSKPHDVPGKPELVPHSHVLPEKPTLVPTTLEAPNKPTLNEKVHGQPVKPGVPENAKHTTPDKPEIRETARHTLPEKPVVERLTDKVADRPGAVVPVQNHQIRERPTVPEIERPRVPEIGIPAPDLEGMFDGPAQAPQYDAYEYGPPLFDGHPARFSDNRINTHWM